MKKKRYSGKLAERMFLEMMAGRSVHAICREEWSPAEMTFYRWIRDHPVFLEGYKLAREVQSHTLMDRIPEWIDHEENPHALTAKTRAAEIFAKRCAPAKYGDRQAVEHTGMNEITIVTAIPEPDPNWGNQGGEDDEP